MLGNLFGKSKAPQPPTNEMEAFYLQQFMSSNKSDASTPRPLNAQNPFIQMPQNTQDSPYQNTSYPSDEMIMSQRPHLAGPQPYPPMNQMPPQSFNPAMNGQIPPVQPPYPGMNQMPPQSFNHPMSGPQPYPPMSQVPPQPFNSQMAPQMPSPHYGSPTQSLHPGISPQAAPFMTPSIDSSQALYPDMSVPYMPQLLPTDFSGVSLPTNQKSFEPSLSHSLDEKPKGSPESTLLPNQTTFVERQLEQHEQRLEHLHDRMKTIETYLQLVPPK